MAVSIDRFLTKFDGVKKTGANWMAKCPAHNDQKPSLSIKEGREGGIVLFCHGGCETKNVLAAAGWSVADIQPDRPENGSNGSYKLKIKTIYDYRDESGKLVYQVVRLEPKDFRPRRPDGIGRWIWDLKGVDRVLYRLPELIADDSDGWIFIVEGEADVDNLRALGLTVTSNVGGAGKWRKEYAKYFKGRKVCIIPDNDPPRTIGKDGKPKEGFAGQKHAVKIYDSIREAAECAIILALPDLSVKGDTSDWLRAGGTRADLLRMTDDLAKLPVEQFAARVSKYSRLVADPDFDGDPAGALREDPQISQDQIQIDHGLINKLHILTELAWAALLAANKPPKYFRRGSTLVKVAQENDSVALKELTPDRMRCELDLVADWRKRGADHKPPKDVVANVLVWPDQPLPALNSIVEVPIFSPNGILQTEPGYHPDCKAYYHPPRHIKCRSVLQTPSDDQLKWAVNLIEEMVCDFPFASDADKAHAIALMLLPFCREMIDGPTPLHLFEASKERTGKSKLVNNLLFISLGKRITRMNDAGKNQEEWAKEITSALREDNMAVFIDNINYRLDSGKLAKALTEPEWNGRILGRSDLVKIPIRCVWAATGNNMSTSGEIAGRIVRCRLVADVESPELRTGFKHPDLELWVVEQRENLIYACHILVQNWIAKGKPKPRVKSFSSYGDWTCAMGGILENAGVSGFLANFAESSDELNADKVVWRTFFGLWWDRFNGRAMKPSELVFLADSIDGFPLTGDTDRAKATALGKKLYARKDAVFGSYKLTRPSIKGAEGSSLWKLQEVKRRSSTE